jgi:hypothetical protein
MESAWALALGDGILYQPVLAANVGHKASLGGLAAYVRDGIDRKAIAAWSSLRDQNYSRRKC